MALIHHGAMMQIDAYNVDGTLNPKVYKRLSRLNADPNDLPPTAIRNENPSTGRAVPMP